jgi:elongation factor Ts
MNQAASEDIITAGRDVAMQIAAMKPLAVDADSVPEEIVAREKAIAVEQIMAEGKPADMAEKIAAGKLNKFFKESTLLPQAFVKDNSKTVAEYLTSVSKGLTVVSFQRLAVGS